MFDKIFDQKPGIKTFTKTLSKLENSIPRKWDDPKVGKILYQSLKAGKREQEEIEGFKLLNQTLKRWRTLEDLFGKKKKKK